MSNVLNLNRSYDLYITQTWPPHNDHGVSGHVYEIIDYYMLLRQKYNVGILLCENIDWTLFKNIITEKYNLTPDVLNEIENNTTFHYKPKMVRGKSILFVDGHLKRCLYEQGVMLLFDNIFSFKCNHKDTHHDLELYKNIRLLQDDRVYPGCLDCDISTFYKKKIYFKYYKPPAESPHDVAMLYVTENCRELTSEQLSQVVSQYNFSDYLVITNIPDKYTHIHGINIQQPPVKDVLSKFSTYIYTPVKQCFDCSPRFIAECKYYNKNVIYHDITDEYLAVDTGLAVRKRDIDIDFESIVLKDDDVLLDILDEYL